MRRKSVGLLYQRSKAVNRKLDSVDPRVDRGRGPTALQAEEQQQQSDAVGL